MRIAVRYDMANSKGETRRQMNERFGRPSPVADVSLDGAYLMRVYWELNPFKSAGFNGPEAMQPRMISDWMELFKTPLSLDEINVIMKMDKMFNKTYHAETSAKEQSYTDTGA